MPIINFLLMAIFLMVSFQDFKYRAISWWLIPLLGAVIIINGLLIISINTLAIYFFINLGFIFFQFSILTIYFSIRNKKKVNILNTYIGLGDILFLIVLCAFFEPYQFIIFNVVGLFLVLIVYLLITLVNKKVSELIPLAGSLSLIMVVLIFIHALVPNLNFYNQFLLEKILFNFNG